MGLSRARDQVGQAAQTLAAHRERAYQSRRILEFHGNLHLQGFVLITFRKLCIEAYFCLQTLPLLFE